MKNIKIIGFDADDTLWVNEPFYQETEKKYQQLLSEYGSEEAIGKELFSTEMNNIELYGFGAKSFLLSMIETALKVSKQQISQCTIDKIINLGKELINSPMEVFENVEKVLSRLSKNYVLIVATKGDLLDQERKLRVSGLGKYFHHIEIMSDKQSENYAKLLAHLDVTPEEFLMIGNSVKSDILPVLELGGNVIHVPFHTTWAHEVVDKNDSIFNFPVVDNISQIIGMIFDETQN
ncbi:MAG: HAD family hydrolase [Bacteroidetes bacterium]|nr:HAD family hydrolase [Bacteroidota bacterium]